MLAVLSMMHAKAQIFEYLNSASQNVIVRDCGPGEILSYMEDASGQGSFMYLKTGMPTSVFPCLTDWTVRDVRVKDGEAYFCGTTTNRKALIGCFNIAAAFAGVGSVNYVTLNWLSFSDSNVLATDLKRLDLFSSGGRTVMAMVGDAMFNHPSYPTYTIVSAYFTAGAWQVEQFVNKDVHTIYTDIACLDDMVVAVGTDTAGSNCLMKSFQLLPDFPSHPFTWRSMAKLSTTGLVGKVLAVKDGGNKMNVAQHIFPARPETILHRISFDPTTGLPATTITYQVTATGSALGYSAYGWTLHELVSNSNGVFVLERAEHPTAVTGMQRWLLNFKTNYLSTTLDAWQMIVGYFHTMDKNGTGYVQLAGSSSSSSYEVYGNVCTRPSPTCSPFFSMPLTVGSASWSLVEMDEGSLDSSYTALFYIPNISNVRRRKICE